MTVLRERGLEHDFPPAWTASKYDEWPFYRKHIQSAFGGSKAMDFVAQDTRGVLWLVEVKDYRVHERTKPSEVADEVACKVRDTLAGLVAAAKISWEHRHRADAIKHLQAGSVRVVLHLEQPRKPSRLRPRVVDPANVLQKLKLLVRVVDPHPLVIDESSASAVSWDVRSVA